MHAAGRACRAQTYVVESECSVTYTGSLAYDYPVGPLTHPLRSASKSSESLHLLLSPPCAQSHNMPTALASTQPASPGVLMARAALARAREVIAEGIANPFADSALRHILTPTDSWTSPQGIMHGVPPPSSAEIYLRMDSGTRSTGNLAPWVVLLICGSDNVVTVRLQCG